MTDTTESSPVASAALSPIIKPKKKVTVPAKKPVAARPPTSVMVTAAIKELNERKGSSLAAIKKYLAANYKVDPVKVAPFIKRFLIASVTNGTILQIKGSYKLAPAKAKTKKAVAKKPIVVKKVKAVVTSTPKAKKPTTAKKSKAVSGEPAAKKVKKTPAKASKAVLPATVKPTKKAKASGKKPAAKPNTPKKGATKKPVLKKK